VSPYISFIIIFKYNFSYRKVFRVGSFGGIFLYVVFFSWRFVFVLLRNGDIPPVLDSSEEDEVEVNIFGTSSANRKKEKEEKRSLGRECYFQEEEEAAAVSLLSGFFFFSLAIPQE
jgi:hypothetical protein